MIGTNEPSAEARDAFDAMTDDAAHAAIECFEDLGLPDEGSDQRAQILEQLNDAIASIMRDWL